MRTTTKKGFTLIEMLVSVAIFSVVMVMALGALLSLSAADRKAEALKSAVDNLNFALDSMSRAIRTGSSYGCSASGTPVAGVNCANGGNNIVFTSNTDVQTYYRLESSVTDPSGVVASCGQSLTTAPMCGQTTAAAGCLEVSVGGTGNWAPITSPDVVVKDFSANSGYPFYVIGAAAGSADNTQPIVVMTIAGYAQVSATQQGCFEVQSTVAQRIYDQ